MINAWRYESEILRVKDVYGRFFWVSRRHFENPEKVQLSICNGQGLRRTYTNAGRDGMNSLHRDNIAEVLQSRTIPL